MRKRKFEVIEFRSNPTLPNKRFGLLETNFTSDGPRTRVCDHRFPTETLAREYAATLEEQ